MCTIGGSGPRTRGRVFLLCHACSIAPTLPRISFEIEMRVSFFDFSSAIILGRSWSQQIGIEMHGHYGESIGTCGRAFCQWNIRKIVPTHPEFSFKRSTRASSSDFSSALVLGRSCFHQVGSEIS